MMSAIMARMPNFGWDLLKFLDNSKEYSLSAAVKVAMIIGGVLMVSGLVVLGIGLFKKSNTQQPVPYGTAFALMIVGGIMMVGGNQLYKHIGSGLANSVNDMGNEGKGTHGSKDDNQVDMGSNGMIVLKNATAVLPR